MVQCMLKLRKKTQRIGFPHRSKDRIGQVGAHRAKIKLLDSSSKSDQLSARIQRIFFKQQQQ